MLEVPPEPDKSILSRLVVMTRKDSKVSDAAPLSSGFLQDSRSCCLSDTSAYDDFRTIGLRLG